MQNSHSDTPPSAASPLSRWERRGLLLFLVVLLGFGGLVEMRAVFLKRRMTDLGVYLRTAWAVRAGADIYDVTEENDWHYVYPPLFAILMTPLADPPPGADRAGYLPFGVSAAVWYVFNLSCLVIGVHLLARVLEEGSCDPSVRGQPAFCRRWWRLRVFPVLACLVPVGHTLMRGQVSLILLVLFAATVAALARGRSVRAGLWLSAAICLKVIPAVLLLLPVWRRDVRFLGGCLLGLAVGLVAVPAAVFGWPQTVRYYKDFDHKVLRPGLGDDQDKSRAKELMETTATDSQSLVAIIHNTMYLDRATRPADASPMVRGLHWLGGGLLLLISLGVAGRRRASNAALVLFLGALIFNMLFLSPVCHLHYMCLLIPLVMGLLAAAWDRAGGMRLTPPLLALLGFNLLTSVLPVLPQLEVFRDLGLSMYGAVALWLAGCRLLWREGWSRPAATTPGDAGPPLAAAA